jgi:hypothetical protein
MMSPPQETIAPGNADLERDFSHVPPGTPMIVIEDAVSPQGISFHKGQPATFIKVGKNGWTLVRDKAGTQCWLATQHLQLAGPDQVPRSDPAAPSLRANAEVSLAPQRCPFNTSLQIDNNTYRLGRAK